MNKPRIHSPLTVPTHRIATVRQRSRHVLGELPVIGVQGGSERCRHSVHLSSGSTGPSYSVGVPSPPFPRGQKARCAVTLRGECRWSVERFSWCCKTDTMYSGGAVSTVKGQNPVSLPSCNPFSLCVSRIGAHYLQRVIIDPSVVSPCETDFLKIWAGKRFPVTSANLPKATIYTESGL